MRITIIYDNDVWKEGLKADWGFSCLIETEDEAILFDTGARGDILLSNMKKLDIDPRMISKIVISHEHWDHSGGLQALVPLVGDVELYRLGKKSPSENMQLVSAEEPQVKGPVDEQSLVLKGKKGWYVLVGCSHPGVEKIIDAAKQFGNIVGLVGGLHGFNNFVLLEGLDIVCATHCTKHKKEIHELFPGISIDGGVGKIIEI
jgi:7,8-dihydropterin-6-yl-methyl-4-(beta-D-ribofuranosyl)aminobenzene 5'-phosphate synthase